MGLVSHEAPRLTDHGPVPYDAATRGGRWRPAWWCRSRPRCKHPKRGFIKLEDTVAVTPAGYEIFGEAGRGWNRGGTAVG